MDTPDVSVVIPTLNRWGFLERALELVLAQDDVTLEVLVIDDGSEDETPVRLAHASDPRLRTLRHDRPRGVAQARNAGAALAHGEWTAFLDDDDLWAPRKLRLQLDAAARAEGSFAYGSSIVIDERGRALGVDPAPPELNLLEDLLKHNSIPGGCSNLIARTELLRRVGGFDESLRQLADWDMWIRLAAEGRPAATEEIVMAYVDHASSMHVKEAEVALKELHYLSAKHRDLVARHGSQMGGGAWFYTWVAGGQHRAGDRLGAARTYLRGAGRYRSKGALLRAAVGLVSGRLVRRDILEPLRPVDRLPGWLEGAR